MREGYIPGTFYLVFAGPVRDLRIVRGGRSPAEECGDRGDRPVRMRGVRPLRRRGVERPVATEHDAAVLRPPPQAPPRGPTPEGRLRRGRQIGVVAGFPPNDRQSVETRGMNPADPGVKSNRRD